MQAKKLAAASIVVATPLFAPFGSTVAQEALSASLTLGERIRSVNESGPDQDGDDGTSLVTTLGFNLNSETRSQRLNFNLDTALPFYLDGGPEDQDDFEFEDPTARLSYAIENNSTALTFDAGYRRRDVGDTTFFDDDLDLDVATGSGTRTILSFSPRLLLNRNGPVSAEVGYRYVDDTYSGADPSISDTTTEAVDGRIRVRVSPVTDAFVFARSTDLERENADDNDRTTTAFGVGADYAFSSVTDISASIFYDEDETTDSDGNVVDSNDGLGFDLGVLRALSNGAYRLNARSSETINGARYQLTAGRDLILPRGLIDASLGVVRNEGESIEPIVNLLFSNEISDISQINLRLSQSASTNDDDNNVIRSLIILDYNHQINAQSSLTAGLQVADDNETGAGAMDERTISASISYNYALGQEWDLVSGFSYRTEQRDSIEDGTTSTVFVGLQKRFDWRP